MAPAVSRGVKAWAVAAVAILALAGCAGEAGRIPLQVPSPPPLSGPAGSPRLAVRPVRDAREAALRQAREGWFLEQLPDEAFAPSPARAVTRALVDRLRACGRFGQVFEVGVEEGVEEPFTPPRDPPPADLVLEGDLHTFYVERSTVSNPFFSMLAAPLGLPLAAVSGLRLLPAPVAPILPVNYRANLTMEVRLVDAESGSLVWGRTIEGIGELSQSAVTDFFKGRETLMKEVASRAIEIGMERLARQLPSPDWLLARWPPHRILAPNPPASGRR